MTSPSDPNAGPTSGLLARLRGMMQALKSPEEDAPGEIAPTWETLAASPAPGQLPLALPVSESELVVAPPVATPIVDLSEVVPSQPIDPESGAQPVLIAQALDQPPPQPCRFCPACQAPRVSVGTYCDSCGYLFPPEEDTMPAKANDVGRGPGQLLKDRYELLEKMGERGGVERFRGLDHGAAPGQPVSVVILRMVMPLLAEAVPAIEDDVKVESRIPPALAETDEVLPIFDMPALEAPVTLLLPEGPVWPSISWEKKLLQTACHPALPAIVEAFRDKGYEVLIEEAPTGRSLWDSWDDPDATAEERFGWLKQIAEALTAIHESKAILEALRPDIVVITANGQARLTDVSDLLPLPMPPDTPLRATLYTAPELVHAGQADARADLYSFGAMLYSLHVGRELTEMDFERPGSPKPFIPRFPDIHPVFGRLITKTFHRDPAARFPTDEAIKEDPSGFAELMRTLSVCQRTYDNVRLEIASWTTTGMVRTGNEDVFALLHAVESRQDDLEESALVLLADGMGGYEAGEVAAALAIGALRKNLLEQPPFRQLAGGSAYVLEAPAGGTNTPAALDVEECQRLIQAALRDANKQVYNGARNGIGRRGMGCTAEAVFVTGRHVVVGHVGDSRTYHFHEGRLIQLTRDHTLVNRLVELGTLTLEEAEKHPRRNELQQAIGGRADVDPSLYHGLMKPGDWVVVCSDGVSNHITSAMLKEMLQSEATSAEMAARRLVNLVNIEGATDNATVVVIRAT